MTTVVTNDAGEIDYSATLCPLFKAGVCDKGKRCKYSHTMNAENFAASNIDIYQDPRPAAKQPDTIITCKEFIKACEQDLYGFKWVCPNRGDDCNYMHRLPQGYVLIKDKDKKVKMPGDSDEEVQLTIEEQIEEERAKLPTEGLTPVTFDSFQKWKAEKADKKQRELEERLAAEQAVKGGGKGKAGTVQQSYGIMSGKALFTYDPTLF